MGVVSRISTNLEPVMIAARIAFRLRARFVVWSGVSIGQGQSNRSIERSDVFVWIDRRRVANGMDETRSNNTRDGRVDDMSDRRTTRK